MFQNRKAETRIQTGLAAVAVYGEKRLFSFFGGVRG
jgi:hypothetical protein